MDKIEVQGSLTFEHNGYLYRVTSDVYKWDPDYIYNAGEYVLYRGKLLQAKTKTPGAWLFNFDTVKPTDRLTRNSTNDDLEPIHQSLNEIRAKLGLEPFEPDEPDSVDPGFNPEYPGCGPEEGGDDTRPPCNQDDVDPDFTMKPWVGIELRLQTIEKTYVRTINNQPPISGNINIDYDGSVEPPESTLLRWSESNTLDLKPENKIQYMIDETPMQVIAYDGSLHLGSENLHLDIATVDTVTINGADVVTSETVVDLINDQNISGKKHFDYLSTTEAPQDDIQVPNSGWVNETIDTKLQDAIKPRLVETTTYYIDSASLADDEDGSKDFPFKTLKNAVCYIKEVDINFQAVTLEFTGAYTDNSEVLELPEVGPTVKIINRSKAEVIMPPLYVTGHWDIDGVILCDNRLGQCPLEVDRGFCVLRNATVSLRTPAPATDAIFVHNTGVLQLASGCTIEIVNESTINVEHAIHVKAGTLIGNEDVHSNVGETNYLSISKDNSSFGVALWLENGARALYLESTDFTSPVGCTPYVAQKASVLQGLTLPPGAQGESDASSIIALLPKTLDDSLSH